MSGEPKAIQRSFRLSARTLELLESAARYSGESRNALADRLISEGARIEQHPTIRFRDAPRRRRVAYLVGTRLNVHQVMATLRESDLDVSGAAAYLGIDPLLVQAAAQYNADFPEDVEADAVQAADIEAEELARWDRARQPGQ